MAEVRATDSHDQATTIRKVAKNRWVVQAPVHGDAVAVEYLVYCHELTVRTADVTPSHAFWNHACVLMWPLGMRQTPADILVRIPGSWSLSTSLLPQVDAATTPHGIREVLLTAPDMERAYDCPVLAGQFQVIAWQSLGIAHWMALSEFGPMPIPGTIAGDADRVICSAAAIFGGRLPYDRYAIQCVASVDGGGGLEHADSTTLIHPRTQLHTRRGYLEFISLVAHEHFHCWNVKRMRPREFVAIDYESENLTEFLWLAEGWTAYYDDLLCLRAGVSTQSEYLAALAKSLQALENNPGRTRLGLSDSSRDAWIRLYRPDENTRNSSQNYYGNGAVLAMCLDLHLRAASQGQRSLDDVVRTLYHESPAYGRHDVLEAIRRHGNSAIVDFLVAAVDGPFEPPVEALLREHGVRVSRRDAGLPHLGVQFEAGGTNVASVMRNAPAWQGGLMPGDEILAVQRVRVDAARWQEIVAALAKPGQPLELLIARRGMVQSVTMTVGKTPGIPELEIDPSASPAVAALRSRWLGHAEPKP